MGSIRTALIIAACVTAGYGGSGAIAWYRQAPRLEISPEIDLGELQHDEEVELSIGFRNVGDSVLVMDPPIAGCQCAPAELSKSRFNPGEQGSFRLTLRPARPPGTEYMQEITIPSNDPDAPQRVMVVRGRMAGSLVSKPKVVRVHGVPVGEPWTSSIVVRCTDRDARFQVTSVTCDLPGSTLNAPLAIQDGDAGELRYEFDVSQIPEHVGQATGEILVHTTHPRFHTLRIPINVEIQSQVTLDPPAVLLDAASPDSQVIVEVSATKPIQLSLPEGVKSAELYHVELTEGDRKDRWRIAVALNSQVSLESVETSQIRLAVSGLTHESEISIPVTALPALDAAVTTVNHAK